MTERFGYGKLLPKDVWNDYNVVSFIIRQLMGNISVAMPVKVVSCTNSGAVSPVGYVDVQPLINQIDGQGFATPHGNLHRLPYLRMQGGKNAIIMDPEAGDYGLAVFADRDASTFKLTKAQANPGSRRRFDMSDGFYLGGFLNGNPNQYVEFITGTGIKVVDSNGNTVVTTSSGIKLTDKTGNVINMDSSGVDVTAARLTCTGSIIAGFGGADQIGLQTHIHDQGNDSGGDTEVPTTAPVPGT